MKTLLKDADKFYRPKDRPSGHDISTAFAKDNGGAIPPNLLEIPNTDSNSHYLRHCKRLGIKGHPSRFPPGLPRFFINFLAEPGDSVLDIFSGSNTTGYVTEELGRSWRSIELDREYAVLSGLRFMKDWDEEAIVGTLQEMREGHVVDFGDASLASSRLLQR